MYDLHFIIWHLFLSFFFSIKKNISCILRQNAGHYVALNWFLSYWNGHLKGWHFLRHSIVDIGSVLLTWLRFSYHFGCNQKYFLFCFLFFFLSFFPFIFFYSFPAAAITFFCLIFFFFFPIFPDSLVPFQFLLKQSDIDLSMINEQMFFLYYFIALVLWSHTNL